MASTKSKKTTSSKEEDVEGMVEGVSSAHSWIKVQTMIRPTKLGTKRDPDEDEDGEDEDDVQIMLTSRNPNDSYSQIWWIHEKGEFKQVAFKETMIDHLEIECQSVLKDVEELTKEQILNIPGTDGEKEEGDEAPGKDALVEDIKRANHFAFLDRATQTKVFEIQETTTQTDPPPIADFCDTVSPYVVHDFFMNQEKRKEDEEREAILELANKSKETDSEDVVELDKSKHVEEKLLTSAKIIERMLNLNTFEDVARDFRFYEDPADEFKNPDGSLLPLWNFQYETGEQMEVTHLMWSPNYTDLFGVSLGSFNFYNQLKVGYVCIFSLKNPSYPEYICKASSGIISFDIHPSHPHMIVVGLYNGNVAVYNLRSECSAPCFSSSAASGKHQDIVWQVRWVRDNLDGYLNFYSVAGDGRVTNWTIVKTSLWHSDKLLLKYSKKLTIGDGLAEHLVDAPRCIAFKPDDENVFIVGTEEGDIYLATTEFSTEFLMKYSGHSTPINSVMWNPYFSSVFLSCASEYTVNVWHKDFPSPLVMYDLGSQVGDIAWAPYSSTVFAAVTIDCRVLVFDLTLNKYSPICNQKVLSSSQGILNRLSFSPSEPLIIVGDGNGIVRSMKLSPNLRKRNKQTEEALKENNFKLFKHLEYSKLEDILAQVVPKEKEN